MALGLSGVALALGLVAVVLAWRAHVVAGRAERSLEALTTRLEEGVRAPGADADADATDARSPGAPHLVRMAPISPTEAIASALLRLDAALAEPNAFHDIAYIRAQFEAGDTMIYAREWATAFRFFGVDLDANTPLVGLVWEDAERGQNAVRALVELGARNPEAFEAGDAQAALRLAQRILAGFG